MPPGVSPGSPDALARSLTVEEKKLVELVRALSVDPDVLILDEITAAYFPTTTAPCSMILCCFSRDQGKLILFVSHNLPEILSSAIESVLKDGEKGDHHRGRRRD